MTTGTGPGGVSRKWIILIGAVVLALLVGGTVYGLSRLIPSAATPVSTPTPVVTTDAPTSAGPTPSAPVSATQTPSATPTLTPTEESPYCKAFGRITSGGIKGTSSDGSIDFAALSDQFGTLITRYSAAAAVAPDSLKADYAKVLAYLKQGKKAVDAKSLEELRTMVNNLSSLNDAMSNIQAESKALCG